MLVPLTELLLCSDQHFLERTGETIHYEYVVVAGVVRAFVYTPKGEDVTTMLYTDGQAISPTLLRSLDGRCFYNLQVISDKATILRFSRAGMQAQMQDNVELERFGHQAIMRDAAFRAEREAYLLKSSALERLNWLRERFPNIENRIPHYYIASFLGITPTSLSRLRHHR